MHSSRPTANVETIIITPDTCSKLQVINKNKCSLRNVNHESTTRVSRREKAAIDLFVTHISEAHNHKSQSRCLTRNNYRVSASQHWRMCVRLLSCRISNVLILKTSYFSFFCFHMVITERNDHGTSVCLNIHFFIQKHIFCR